jgi:hypothetical protein
MQISTYLSPNIHHNGLEILEVMEHFTLWLSAERTSNSSNLIGGEENFVY